MFKTKEIKTNILGEKLRNAREARSLSLKQLSEKTKIPVNYLEYLEKGDYKMLPNDIYINAYLKKYCQTLDLNTSEILKQFKTERGITTDPKRSKANTKEFINYERKPVLVVTPKRATLVLGIMVICIVFGFFWHQLSYLIYPPNLEIAQPASDITVSEQTIKVSGTTDTDVNLTVNDKEVYVKDDGNFESMVDLNPGLNIIKVKIKDRFGNTNTVIRRIMVIQK